MASKALQAHVVAGLAALPLAIFLASTPLSAQASFGVQLSWGDQNLDFGVGARVAAPTEFLEAWSPNLRLVGSVDYFFPDSDVRYFELNGNLLYLFEAAGDNPLRPYVGAGLSFARASVEFLGVTVAESDLALNLLGGVQLTPKDGTVTPFVELRLATREEQIVISVGVMF